MSSQTEVKPVEQAQTPVENQINTVEANKSQQAQQTPESDQEKNWKAFREARDIERKLAEEISRQAKKSHEEAAALKAALDAVLNKPSTQNNTNFENEYPEETDDQKIEKKVSDLLARREAENDKKRQEQEAQEFPQRLNRDYSDFSQVCSPDNLDYLEYHYPEISKAFAHMPQGYDKWSSIYKAIKRFVPNPDSKKDLSRADKNFNKPQSISSPGVTQSNQAAAPFRLDEKRKAENYSRMQRIMNKLD